MNMEKYGILVEDAGFYLKGTEFKITNSDDGMWLNYPFYQVILGNGERFCFDDDDYLKVEIIDDGSYTGKIVLDQWFYDLINNK